MQESNDAPLTERHMLVEIAIAVPRRVHQHEPVCRSGASRFDGLAQPTDRVNDQITWVSVNALQTNAVSQTGSHFDHPPPVGESILSEREQDTMLDLFRMVLPHDPREARASHVQMLSDVWFLVHAFVWRAERSLTFELRGSRQRTARKERLLGPIPQLRMHSASFQYC